MGSRKFRLANEALRQQQVAIDRQNRIAERQAIITIVKNFLSACAEQIQYMSNEQAERLREFRKEFHAAEVVRKQQALEEIIARKTTTMQYLKSQDQERRKCAKEERNARREFLSELLDLDF
jgi:hypothetical protein